MIVWLTGNSGSGKSTVADNYKKIYPNTVVLHGDQCRHVWPGLRFSKEDRLTQNLRVARLAKMLSNQGFLVLVAVIAPFQDVRDEIDTICSPVWAWVDRESLGDNPERPYEKPELYSFKIDNDKFSEEEAVEYFERYLKEIL